MTGLARSVG